MFFVTYVVGAKWLGHGRRVEALLALITLLHGLAFLIPEATFSSQAVRDIAWSGYGQVISVPFLLHATLTGYGVIANINAWPLSRYSRLFGGFAGLFIWPWMILKFVLVGAPFASGVMCAVGFLMASIGIVAMSLANLPRPGAPGAL